MQKLLVYRFSAMRDVILLLPVLKGLLAANNDVEVYLLTQSSLSPLFANIDRLSVVKADLKQEHRGFRGLLKLFRKIHSEIKPDRVFDLHGVLRSFFLDFLFKFSGYNVRVFKKGTLQKRRVIKSKLLNQLPGTIDRYSDVFTSAGFELRLPELPVFKSGALPFRFDEICLKPIVIGIAPFAKHRQKVWGVHKIDKLLEQINTLYDCTILLFGGGKAEFEILNKLANKHSNCVVSSNYFNFNDEINLMHRLSLMVSMDSANMHLASMAGVPTVSIWGATHPALGFAPYKQPAENMIQYTGPELACRPCSVYGNKKCIYSDSIRCMEYIAVDSVIERIKELIPVPENQNR